MKSNKICTCDCHVQGDNVMHFMPCCEHTYEKYLVRIQGGKIIFDDYAYNRITQKDKLLTRDEFREAVFKRDNNRCIVCGYEGYLDAHHILERRLFDDYGYYLDNGATLCAEHHIEAEKTLISATELREILKIDYPVLPEHLYGDAVYDKWGNIILPNGTRTKGELFHDESVQKILKTVIDTGIFVDYMKYPRTYHLPWTGSKTTDDKVLKDTQMFAGQEVVVTEKMDGENSTIYSNGYFHARSVDGRNHPSQTWLKNYMQGFCYDIPEGWRICGENLYATHAIHYPFLDSYFQVFSIWDDKNICLDWDETVEWCELLGLKHVPVIFKGLYDEETIRKIELDYTQKEGYIVRLGGEFHYSAFRKSIAKCVRPNHVNTAVHNWRSNWDSRNINQTMGDNEVQN